MVAVRSNCIQSFGLVAELCQRPGPLFTMVEGPDEEADGNAALVPLRLEHTYAVKAIVSE